MFLHQLWKTCSINSFPTHLFGVGKENYFVWWLCLRLPLATCIYFKINVDLRCVSIRPHRNLGLSCERRKNPSPTAILSHHLTAGHPISFDYFKILSYCSFESELPLHESMLNAKIKPNSNDNIGSAPFFLFWHFYFVSSDPSFGT